MINFHSHKENGIYSIDLNINKSIPDNRSFTLGLHPWTIKTDDIQHLIDSINEHKRNSHYLCIGEVGIDRIQGASLEIQKRVLEKIFQEYNQEIVVIHSVKALSDILEIVDSTSFKGVLIFHDFNGNNIEINEIVKRGYYFSLGSNLFRNSKLTQNIDSIPTNKVFLETDDNDRDIESVYLQFATLRKINIDELINQVDTNFKNLFKKDFNEL